MSVPLTSILTHVSDNVRDTYAKKTADEIAAEVNCQLFFMGRQQYERLEGQEGQTFSATKMNFEKPPAGGGARG